MQIFPTKADSLFMAVGRAQALSLHLQGTNPASKSLGWLLASCEQEGREEDESQGEALLSLQCPEQLHHPCCTRPTPPRMAPGPQMPLAQGDSRTPPLCPHGNARHRDLREKTAKVTHPLPMSSHSFAPSWCWKHHCHSRCWALPHLGHQIQRWIWQDLLGPWQVPL